MALVHVTRVGAVAILALTHEGKPPVLSTALVAALNAALDEAEADAAVHCLILAADGKAFIAGADIGELAAYTPALAAETDFVAAWQRLGRCTKPIIAEINGYCLGGGLEMALLCDILVASDAAHFGQPEITLGTIPGSGATQRLSALIGKHRTMELCLTGRILTAAEAVAWGLIHTTVAPERLRETTLAMATRIAGFSPPLVTLLKQLIRDGVEAPLQDGLARERQAFYGTFHLHDHQEGLAAFLNKRPPQFQGR